MFRPGLYFCVRFEGYAVSPNVSPVSGMRFAIIRAANASDSRRLRLFRGYAIIRAPFFFHSCLRLCRRTFGRCPVTQQMRNKCANVGAKISRTTTSLLFVFFATACASTSQYGGGEWAANGYLSPAPTLTPELIGIFDNEADCRDAADAWMSRQVVGNPVFAECLPIDRD